MKWILIGVDGTGSSKWAKPSGENSHVQTFCQKFGTGLSSIDLNKKYLDGPDKEMTGSDSTSIKDSVVSFILKSLESMFSSSTTTREKVEMLGKTYKTVTEKIPDPANQAIRNHDSLRIVLTGHSRGGAIVIDIANKLAKHNIPVYFMGLFDAVDRSNHIDGGPIKNTRHAYHALRGLKDSRSYFKNTGTDFNALPGGKLFNGVSKSGTNYWHFDTSHGGIGGDIDPTPTGITDDFSCAIWTQQELAKLIVKTQITTGSVTFDGKARREIVNTCMKESENAYKWMVENARKCDLPI